MIDFTLSGNRSVYEAARRVRDIVPVVRDSDDVQYRRRCAANGQLCSVCGREPPSGTLFEIVLRHWPTGDEGVMIGPICAGRYLRYVLVEELREVRSGTFV